MKHIRIYIKLVFTLTFYLSCSYANAQQLENLINEALLNNPEIQKFDLEYQRTSEKINEVKNIPNTEFNVGYFISEPETRTGAQKFKVSAKQMLPWFGTITSRENYINSLADNKFNDIIIAKRKLIVSVSQSYYNLYALKAKQRVIAENISLLKTYETLALKSLEVGKASAVDVLKIQMRENEMQEAEQVLQQQFLAEQTRLNNLMNKPADDSISVVEKLNIPDEDVVVVNNSLKLHPELIKFDKLYQSVEESELLNHKDKSPKIGFGLDYINVEPRPDMSFTDNGKDIVMPMITVSIPIFNKKYKSQTEQNIIQQQEIVAQKQERFNNLETKLRQAIHERNSARITYNTQLKNVKQAMNAENILMKSYEAGTVNFNDVLDVQELQLKFQIGQVESTKSYYNQSAIINYLTQE